MLSLERKFLRIALQINQSLLLVRRQNAPQRMSLSNLWKESVFKTIILAQSCFMARGSAVDRLYYTVPRIPEFLSLRPNWLPPSPSPPEPNGEGTYSPAGEGAGGANSVYWRENLALMYILWALLMSWHCRHFIDLFVFLWRARVCWPLLSNVAYYYFFLVFIFVQMVQMLDHIPYRF